MENIEIEIKIVIDQQKYRSCKDYLEEHAVFIKADNETDQYFNSAKRNFLAPEYPYEWLRLRKKNGKTTLDYKHWYPRNSPVSTHCDELEIEVSNGDALFKIFRALGVRLLITVDKKREKYLYKDQLEVSLDYVMELGFFIEIEYVGEHISISDAQTKIIEFANALNLDISKRDNRGYPYLMLEKSGRLKKYKNDKQSRQQIPSLF